MRLDGTLQNLRGAIPDLSVAGSITATGDIKTDQTFRGTDASITGTLTASNITHGSELTITSNLLMGPGTTLTASNIVGASPVTISSGLVMGSGSTLTTSNIVGSSFLTVTANTNVVAEFTASEKLIKYPRVKMTAATTSGYTASASSYFNNNVTYIPWHVFDGVIDNDTVWISENGTYDGSGIATSSDSFNGVNGSYITIELPTNIKLNYAYIYGRDPTNTNPRRPKTGILYGSTDNSSWTEIGDFSITSLPSIAFGPEIIPHTTGYYKYFRLQITSVFTNGNSAACAITELELYGYPENDLGDGTSVLFKTLPNTPKTDFLDVYYDAKDYDEMPTTITDETGNGNTGTPTNVTFTSTEPKSFEFNGTSSNISATFNSNTLDVGNVHSICMWIKPNAIQSGYKCLFELGENTDHKLIGVFLNGGYVVYLTYGDNLISTYLAEPDRWHFITCTYIPGRKIYVNSQLVSSDTYSSFNITNFSAILGSNLTNAELFDGSIANFRFYDRPLSEDEIWEIYSYQKAYFSVSPDVVTYKAGRVGIGTSEPRAVLDVVGGVNFSPISTWKILGKTGIFSESGDFTLNLNLSQEAQPNTCWEIRLAFGFTGTNSGTFAISGAIGSDGSTVGVSEGNSVRVYGSSSPTVYNWSDASGTTFLTSNREINAPAYLAVIKIANVHGPNISGPVSGTSHRYHFMYECVGCHGGIGATIYKGQGFFQFSSQNTKLNTIKFNCNTGTVNGNYNVLAF